MEPGFVKLGISLFLGSAIMVFYAVALTGCVASSPGLPNLFLVSVNTTGAELRIGYFGVCFLPNGTDPTCASSPYGSSIDSLQTALLKGTAARDAASATKILSKSLPDVLELQRKHFFFLEAVAGAVFALSVALLAAGESLKRSNRTGRAHNFTDGKWPEKTVMASIVLSLTAAVSVMQMGNALEFVASGGSRRLPSGMVVTGIKAGTDLQIVQWVAFATSIVFLGVLLYPVGRRAKDDFGGEAFPPPHDEGFPGPPGPPGPPPPPPPGFSY